MRVLFATLLERHGSLVLGVCWRVLGNLHDAEDAFQAVFLVLARKAASIRRHESLAAWLHRVALNISRTARLSVSRRHSHEKEAVPMTQASPLEVKTLEVWEPTLHEEVDRLPEKYRVPVILCYFEGKTHEQAAQQLGWPLGTVKGRLARARQTLRVRLARRGLVLPACGLVAALTESASAAVPPTLLALTHRAAVSFAAGGVSSTGASAHVVTLAKGAVKTMTATKLLHSIVLLLGVGVTLFGVALGIGAGREALLGSRASATERDLGTSAEKRDRLAQALPPVEDPTKGLQLTLTAMKKTPIMHPAAAGRHRSLPSALLDLVRKGSQRVNRRAQLPGGLAVPHPRVGLLFVPQPPWAASSVVARCGCVAEPNTAMLKRRGLACAS
jgi:RNA polymerase sigma factor (sigma-70 family)